MMRGEWSDSFLTEVADSILPPRESMSWETKNLSIEDMVELALNLPLSYVYAFLDIFWKLSRHHASNRAYCRVMWCQEATSLLYICLSPDIPLRVVSSRWLKSPLIMMWSEANFALLSFFHIGALSLEDRATYTLTMVRELLSANWSVMYWARPSSRIPLSLTTEAVFLSTKMAMPTLVRCERPMGIPGFQKEQPFQNSIPFPALDAPSSPRWCSWMSKICGGEGKEVN